MITNLPYRPAWISLDDNNQSIESNRKLCQNDTCKDPAPWQGWDEVGAGQLRVVHAPVNDVTDVKSLPNIRNPRCSQVYSTLLQKVYFSFSK